MSFWFSTLSGLDFFFVTAQNTGCVQHWEFSRSYKIEPRTASPWPAPTFFSANVAIRWKFYVFSSCQIPKNAFLNRQSRVIKDDIRESCERKFTIKVNTSHRRQITLGIRASFVWRKWLFFYPRSASEKS